MRPSHVFTCALCCFAVGAWGRMAGEGPGTCPALPRQRSPYTAADSCEAMAKTVPLSGAAAPGAAVTGTSVADARLIDDAWTGPHGCVGQFCVFSSPSFGNGRGVAVISTARGAEALAEALEAGAIPWSAEHRTGDAGGEMFEPRPIRGKGVGLVARRPIRRGERIMVQPPVVVVDRPVFDLGADEQARLFDLAVAELPYETSRLFLSQAAQSNAENRVIANLLEANSFNVAFHQRNVVANYLHVSRLNHDCRPNLAWHISPTLGHVTTATADIMPGEELVISYVDPFSVRAVRMERIRQNWGFNCTCSTCAQRDQRLSDLSDQRLWRIYELERRLRPKMSSTSTLDSNAPDAVSLLISLYAQERLGFAMAGVYALAASTHNAFGRADLAIKYASLAAEAGTIEFGDAWADFPSMKRLLEEEDPVAHWSWG